MTVLAPAPAPPAATPPPEARVERVLLPHISWATYTALLADVGDGAARLTYDNGWLEIEMPGWLHELIAALAGELVTATLKRQRIAYIPGRSTTWRTDRRIARPGGGRVLLRSKLVANLRKAPAGPDRRPAARSGD